MQAARVVEREVARELLPGLGHALVGVQVDVLVFHALPQPLDNPGGHPSTFAVHADLDVVVFEHLGKLDTRELTSRIGVEGFRCAVLGDRLFEHFDTEIRGHADRHPYDVSRATRHRVSSAQVPRSG